MRYFTRSVSSILKCSPNFPLVLNLSNDAYSGAPRISITRWTLSPILGKARV